MAMAVIFERNGGGSGIGVGSRTSSRLESVAAIGEVLGVSKMMMGGCLKHS
mgnify:CR=1 FL=1